MGDLLGTYRSQSRPRSALPGSPSIHAGYSFRRLRPGYRGACMRVRRASDNSELDIFFRGDGWADTAALLAFVGAGSGYITTWYDQSGIGNDVSQSTVASQPQIVSSGTVLTQTGRPCASFGSGQRLVKLVSSGLPVGATGGAMAMVVLGVAGGSRIVSYGNALTAAQQRAMGITGTLHNLYLSRGSGESFSTAAIYPASLMSVSAEFLELNIAIWLKTAKLDQRTYGTSTATPAGAALMLGDSSPTYFSLTEAVLCAPADRAAVVANQIGVFAL